MGNLKVRDLSRSWRTRNRAGLGGRHGPVLIALTKVDENAGARRPERPPQAECLPHCSANAVEVVRQEVFDGAALRV